MKKKLILMASYVALVLLMLVAFGYSGEDETQSFVGGSGEPYTGEYTKGLPRIEGIKGQGSFTDEIATLAMATSIKYRILPSVVLSQYAYESAFGRSQSAKNDNNFFGITWFNGCPFPKGSARGIGGSEGGNYMKFPNAEEAFNYYGYMLASQSNFNKSVANQNTGDVLLILGRGGYAASGITESSPYFKGAMAIIESNNLLDYDEVAIPKWESSSLVASGGNPSGSDGIDVLENVMGETLNNGQCYGLTAYYVEKLGGPTLMGSGYSYAERIGEDYDWEKYGWKVILNPKSSDLKAGDIINWYAGGMLSPGIWGHTGVIYRVNEDGSFDTYEQNAGQGQICAKYTRTYGMTKIRSIVRKV